MSDSTYLVGAFFCRKSTASGETAVVDVDVVSRVEGILRCLGMKPAEDIRPIKGVSRNCESEEKWIWERMHCLPATASYTVTLLKIFSS
jgi:hypothetical protein